MKLLGNVCFNPISALTLATLDKVATEAGTRSVARAMMEETLAIGEALDIRVRLDIEKRIDGAAAVGAHRTSMLQDLERGRAMEIDALVTSVQELGRLVGDTHADHQRGAGAGAAAGADGRTVSRVTRCASRPWTDTSAAFVRTMHPRSKPFAEPATM